MATRLHRHGYRSMGEFRAFRVNGLEEPQPNAINQTQGANVNYMQETPISVSYSPIPSIPPKIPSIRCCSEVFGPRQLAKCELLAKRRCLGQHLPVSYKFRRHIHTSTSVAITHDCCPCGPKACSVSGSQHMFITAAEFCQPKLH